MSKIVNEIGSEVVKIMYNIAFWTYGKNVIGNIQEKGVFWI